MRDRVCVSSRRRPYLESILKGLDPNWRRAVGFALRFVSHPIRAIRTRVVFGRWDVNVFGNYTVVHPHNVMVGENLSVNHDVFILGRRRIVIGNNVILSARCMLLDATLVGPSTGRAYRTDSQIEIGDEVWIGAGAMVLAGIKIGDGAVVGAGAVVTHDVESGQTVVGNPARAIAQ